MLNWVSIHFCSKNDVILSVQKHYCALGLGLGLGLGQWRSKWGHAPWGAGFGGASAHFLQSFKTAF